MTRWRNYFSQLLNVHEDNDDRQAEIHTVESLVLEPSAFEAELAIGKLKNHTSPGNVKVNQSRYRLGVAQRVPGS